MEDFKVWSVDSLLTVLKNKEINRDIFFNILLKKIKDDGLTNNQYVFILDVAYETLKSNCMIMDRNNKNE